jgi:hypothetical protein
VRIMWGNQVFPRSYPATNTEDYVA